jgi:hypothetical protein
MFLTSQLLLELTEDPMPKIPKAKRTGDVAQVVEHLPSKCKALSSNPNTAKKQNKNKKTKNLLFQCFVRMCIFILVKCISYYGLSFLKSLKIIVIGSKRS